MGEKVDNILYSLLPLILIIAVSWFFSFLGARAKKKTEQAAGPQQTPPDKDPMELFFGVDDDVESPKPSQQHPATTVTGADSGTTFWQSQGHGVQTTAKPIEPKWWGA